MKSKKALIVLFMAILMVSVVNIYTKNSSQSRTILFEDSIRNINPVNTTGQIWAMLFNQIFERPFTFRKDGELVPQLVEDWNVNKDYTSFTFKFLKGVKFHNGKEMIADDIIYSINYIKKNTREEERLIFENIQNITRIDDLTIRIDLKEPEIDFLYFLANPSIKIFPNNNFENPKLNGFELWVGTGPYRMNSFLEGEKIVLKHFAEYRETITVEKLIFSQYESEKAFEQFENGNIDLMEVSRKKIEELSGREDLIVGSYPMLGSFWLGFNLKLHVFKNKDLRQAILHAIDRTKIVEGKIISEDFIPSTILPYGILGYRKSNSKHDLEKAKYYLSKVPKDQLPTKNDMVVLIPKEIHPMGLYALQSIKKDLKKLNLPFAWKTLDVTYGKGKLADYYHHLRTKKDFKLYFRGMVATIPTSSYLIESTFYDDGAMNFGSYDDKKIKSLKINQDSESRRAIQDYYAKISNILESDIPVIPLGTLKMNWIMKKEKPFDMTAISPMFIHFKENIK